MGQFRQTHRTISILGKVSASGRVWDAPYSAPFKNVSIAVSSSGRLFTAADISFEVFLGGRWVGGSPFLYGTTTHEGGVSQGAPAPLAAATEIAQVIYTSANVFPANAYVGNPSANPGYFGFPLVVELTNNGLITAELNVTFSSESIGTNV